jgi:hypothetical protein
MTTTTTTTTDVSEVEGAAKPSEEDYLAVP